MFINNLLSVFLVLPQPIYQVVENDGEVKKMKTSIEAGMDRAATRVREEYPLTWKE